MTDPNIIEPLHRLANAFERALRANLDRDLYDSAAEYEEVIRNNTALREARWAIWQLEG